MLYLIFNLVTVITNTTQFVVFREIILNFNYKIDTSLVNFQSMNNFFKKGYLNNINFMLNLKNLLCYLNYLFIHKNHSF